MPPRESSGSLDARVEMLDQTRLPGRGGRSSAARLAAGGGRDPRACSIRGAPAIGIAGAMGVALAAQRSRRRRAPGPGAPRSRARPRGCATRGPRRSTWPGRSTRRRACAAAHRGSRRTPRGRRSPPPPGASTTTRWTRCRRIGAHALALLGRGAAHPHPLQRRARWPRAATARPSASSGRRTRPTPRSASWCRETRPLLQGVAADGLGARARRHPVHADRRRDGRLDDGRAARVTHVVVGADRIAANGDVANKIGTYGLAVLAREHGDRRASWPRPPAPSTSRRPRARSIPIEERSADEVRGLSLFGAAASRRDDVRGQPGLRRAPRPASSRRSSPSAACTARPTSARWRRRWRRPPPRPARRRDPALTPARSRARPRSAGSRGCPRSACSTSCCRPACAACGLPGRPACDACLARARAAAGAVVRRVRRPGPGRRRARAPRARGRIADARQAVAYAGPAPGAGRGAEGRTPAGARGRPGAARSRTPCRPRRWARCWCRCRSGRAARARARLQPEPAARRRAGPPLGAPGRRRAASRSREGPDQRGRRRHRAGPPGGGCLRRRAARRVPACAWLVDDVHTTGATLADCARALRAGGRAGSAAVCFARVAGARAMMRRPWVMSRSRDRSGGGREADRRGRSCSSRSRARKCPSPTPSSTTRSRSSRELTRILPPWDEATSVELELSVERNPKIERDSDRRGHRPHQGPGAPGARERRRHVRRPSIRPRASWSARRGATATGARPTHRAAAMDEVPGCRPPSPEPAEARRRPREPPSRALVKSKSFELKPMSAGGSGPAHGPAAPRLLRVPQRADGQVNVVYRRRDGDFGLIVPGLTGLTASAGTPIRPGGLRYDAQVVPTIPRCPHEH